MDAPKVPVYEFNSYPGANDRVVAEMRADRKFSAIKEYRQQTNLGLSEAKRYVEHLWPIYGPPTPTPTIKEETPVSVTTPINGKGDAALEALKALLSPDVNRDDVVAIVKEELASVIFPVTTVVVKDNKEPRKLDGAQHHKLPDIIVNLGAGEHVLMVGPAGTGKSTLAEQAAEALELPFYAISLSPMTPASQVLGYMQAAGEYVSTLYRQAYEHGGVFHFDEFDNAHPSVLAVINASLANGHMAFPDQMIKRHADFRVLASANTYGRGPDRQYVGRQQVDAATLDRFTVETIEIDTALERTLVLNTGIEQTRANEILAYVKHLRKNAEKHKLPVVVSPRASVGMARLIKAGRSWKDAVEARARRGLSDADWSKLSAGAPESA